MSTTQKSDPSLDLPLDVMVMVTPHVDRATLHAYSLVNSVFRKMAIEECAKRRETYTFTSCPPALELTHDGAMSVGAGNTLRLHITAVSPSGKYRYLPRSEYRTFATHVLGKLHEVTGNGNESVVGHPELYRAPTRLERRQVWESLISEPGFHFGPAELDSFETWPPDAETMNAIGLEPFSLQGYAPLWTLVQPHHQCLAYPMEDRRLPSRRGWYPRFGATEGSSGQYRLLGRSTSEHHTTVELAIEISPLIDDFTRTGSDQDSLLMTRLEVNQWLERYVAEVRTRMASPSRSPPEENEGEPDSLQCIFRRGSAFEAKQVTEEKQKYIFRELHWRQLARRE